MCQAPGPIPETSAEQGGNVEVAEKPQEEAGDGRRARKQQVFVMSNVPFFGPELASNDSHP